jgi:hypothetical protein
MTLLKSRHFLIAFDADGWHVARTMGHTVEVRDVRPEPGGPDVPAEALAAQLREWGYRGRGVCLGLPSNLVLAADVDATHLPRRHRRSALVYRFEEQVPVDAESLTTDFLPSVRGRVLGVAAVTSRVREVVEPMAAAGIAVAAICPTALLALWAVLRARPPRTDYAIVASPAQVDIFRLADRQPVGWATVGPDPADLLLGLQADLLARPVDSPPPQALVVGEIDSQAAEVLEAAAAAKLVPAPPDSVLSIAARTAAKLLAGRPCGWVDLRGDGLAPGDARRAAAGPLRAVLALAGLLLLTTAGSFLWRAAQYDAVARHYEAMQLDEFRKLYPGAAEPTNVRSRLKSELLRLAGISGAGQAVPVLPSALDTLRRVVAGLPPTMRLRLLDVRVGPGDVLLEGQARTHSDAEAVAQALSRAGFVPDPPRTEALPDRGVGFTLTAAVGPPPEGAAPKEPTP